MPLTAHRHHPSRVACSGPEPFFRVGSLWRPPAQRNPLLPLESALQAHYCTRLQRGLWDRVRAVCGRKS